SPTRDDAKAAIRTFETKYGAKYPKAVNCLTKDTDALLAFYDFPAEHWVHLRTTNPIPVNRLIESTFATLRHRTVKVKGAFSNESALGMLYQLGLEAEK
ncbi:transposase, partial [Ferrimicrobium acidiphilum]